MSGRGRSGLRFTLLGSVLGLVGSVLVVGLHTGAFVISIFAVIVILSLPLALYIRSSRRNDAFGIGVGVLIILIVGGVLLYWSLTRLTVE
jgi:hypothetical protein